MGNQLRMMLQGLGHTFSHVGNLGINLVWLIHDSHGRSPDSYEQYDGPWFDIFTFSFSNYADGSEPSSLNTFKYARKKKECFEVEMVKSIIYPKNFARMTDYLSCHVIHHPFCLLINM